MLIATNNFVFYRIEKQMKDECVYDKADQFEVPNTFHYCTAWMGDDEHIKITCTSHNNCIHASSNKVYMYMYTNIVTKQQQKTRMG